MHTRTDLDLGRKIAGDISNVIRQELSFEEEGTRHPLRYFAGKLADQFDYLSRRTQKQARDMLGAAFFEGLGATATFAGGGSLIQEGRIGTGIIVITAATGLGIIAAYSLGKRAELLSQSQTYAAHAHAIRDA